MSEEQRLKTLAELSNAETILEMKILLIQLNESIADLRIRLFYLNSESPGGKFNFKANANSFIPETKLTGTF